MKLRRSALACVAASIVLVLGSSGRASIVNPALANFNGDHWVDAADIDILAWAASQPFNALYDLNLDGFVTFAIGPDVTNPTQPQDFATDSDVLVRDILGTDYGDANLDGKVSLMDLDVWATNFRLSGPFGWAQGDFNGTQGADLHVTLADLDVWGGNFRFIGGPGAGPVQVNPEPLSVHVWLLGAIVSYCFAGRRAAR